MKKETYPLPRTKVSAICLSWIKAAWFYNILTNNRKVVCCYSATHHALVIPSPGGDGDCASAVTVLLNHCSAIGHWVWGCYHHPKIPDLIQVLMDTRGWGSVLPFPEQPQYFRQSSVFMWQWYLEWARNMAENSCLWCHCKHIKSAFQVWKLILGKMTIRILNFKTGIHWTDDVQIKAVRLI